MQIRSWSRWRLLSICHPGSTPLRGLAGMTAGSMAMTALYAYNVEKAENVVFRRFEGNERDR
jgi:hypothetical protein